MNSGSLDSLKVSLRRGLSANSRRIRLTVARFRPLVSAIERVLYCVAPRGSDSSVRVTTRSTSSSLTVRGVPGRGASSRPSQPLARNRRRHLPAVARVVPRVAATACLSRSAGRRSEGAGLQGAGTGGTSVPLDEVAAGRAAVRGRGQGRRAPASRRGRPGARPPPSARMARGRRWTEEIRCIVSRTCRSIWPS